MTRNERPELIGDAEWRRLQAVVDELAGEGLDELVAQARVDARGRVREILTEAMTRSMLAQAAGPDIAPPQPPGQEEQPPLGLYVYGVIDADDASSVGGAPGIDPAHRVTTLEVGHLAAVVSQVPLAEFGETRLREHLGDMSWVERVARCHEEVLEATGAAVTVIPMRMCSIFRGEDGVRALLEREAPAMRHALSELRGKSEWGVKAFRVPAPGGAGEPDADAPQTGTSYLERRREARVARERAGAALSERCEIVHHELVSLSARAVLLAPQRPEVSGHNGDMLLNGAYLVDSAQREAFHAAVQNLGAESLAEGLELQLTGPWPAYNFVPDAIGAPA